jgi:uncharacterized protein (DUF1800 family)
LIGLAGCALGLAACGGNDGRVDGPDQGQTAETAQAVLAIDADVVRFLDQASFGPTPATVAEIVSHGGSAGGGYTWWLNHQINELTALPNNKGKTYYNSDDNCRAGHPGITCVEDQFFDHAITADDQLRQRVAFALSEILVTSKVKLTSDAWMASYLNTLVEGAFGNFGDLLQTIAESAAMGQYLDNVNNFVVTRNGVTGVVTTVAPNENFARELMQLFTIGLCKLNTGGTPVLIPVGMPNAGECVPTYDQDDVEHYAHLMSGWTFDTTTGSGACPLKGAARAAFNNTSPMIACDYDHDVTTPRAELPLLKTHGAAANHYLSGEPKTDSTDVDPTHWSARDAMEKPLDSVSHTSGVIDELFRHPNVGPFIGRQLIQRLVTSNPSAAYVGRVTAVFNNDGSNPAVRDPRGNLDSVVTAILTDIEARDTTPTARFGRLREPALYVAGLARVLGVPPTVLAQGSTVVSTTTGPLSFAGVVFVKKVLDANGVFVGTKGRGLSDASAAMGQTVFSSPSVFNYFAPDYAVPSTLLAGAAALDAPELAIEDTNTIFERSNFVNGLVYFSAPTSLLPKALDLSALPATAQGIVDWCNAYMMHNTMSPAMNTTIVGSLATLAGDALKQRAIYLVATSSQYQVAR